MKQDKSYEDFKKAMRQAGIKVSRSNYSDFIGVRLKTAQGCQLNNTVMTADFRQKHEADIAFINAYRESYAVFDGLMRVVF